MRLLVIDGSSDAGDQRSPGILAPDAFQPFLRRLEQGPSRYRYLPTIDAGGGVRWDPISMQALPSYPNIYPN